MSASAGGELMSVAGALEVSEGVRTVLSQPRWQSTHARAAWPRHRVFSGSMHLRVDTRRHSVRTARHWVTRHAKKLDVPRDVVAVAVLLTSELVANAVLHGRGRITVDLHLSEGALTVAVADEGDGLPVMRTTEPSVPGGQGVRLVEQLATRWGVHQHREGGKTVWFTVELGAVAP